MEVKVDDRERRSPVIPELVRLGLKPVFERLEVGDYVVGDVYGVERKSADDFVNSIIDKRLFEQARLLREAYEKPLIVVEGDLELAVAGRGVRINQVLGALLALAEMKVPAVQVSSPERTALIIYLLSRRLEKDSEYLAPVKKRVVRKDSGSVPIAQLNLLATLPGISSTTARRLLEHFRTPRRFFLASPAELRKAGLGPRKISRILAVLDTDFTQTFFSPQERENDKNAEEDMTEG